MRKTTAVNIALCLTVIGWAMSYLGLFAHLGDPNPKVPHEVIEAENRFYWAIFVAGVVLAVGAMWLAGFGYSEAKIRSLITAAMTIVPLVTFGVWMAIGS
jgi:hypothetical protein